MSLNFMHKKLSNFRDRFTGFKKLTSQTKENQNLKAKVLDNDGDLFIELYYTYKERYKEKKDALNKKGIKKLDRTKSGLTDDYLYESDEFEEEKQTDKKPDKKRTT